MRIIAHRSGPSVLPEQTVDSAKLALENGADMVEIDLRFTKDKKIAVSHDENLQRLFSRDINLSELTLDEYKSLKRSDCDYCGHSFEDYISAGIAPLLLHIKEGGENIPGIIGYIASKGYTDKVVLGVHSPEDVKAVKQTDARIPVLAFMKNKEMMQGCIDEGAEYIRLWQKWTDRESIDFIHAKGREVWIMVGHCDGLEAGETTKEFLDFCNDAGVEGILINNVLNYTVD